jgi:hypothetical protein
MLKLPNVIRVSVRWLDEEEVDEEEEEDVAAELVELAEELVDV